MFINRVGAGNKAAKDLKLAYRTVKSTGVSEKADAATTYQKTLIVPHSAMSGAIKTEMEDIDGLKNSEKKKFVRF